MSYSATGAPLPVANDRWLFGPVPDLVFGCGVGYALILAVVILIGHDLQGWLPGGVLVMVVTLANTPHYGATLMRVYE